MASNAPSEGEIRLDKASNGPCNVTRAEYGLGTCAMDLETNAANPPSGSLRGLNRSEVLSFPWTRSTRKVRQSLRVRSHAARYQRYPVCTSRCGSTERVLGAPLRSW